MKLKILFVTFAVSIAAGCSNDILNVKNETSYDATNFFTSAKALTEGSTAMYSPLLFPGMYELEIYELFGLLGNDDDKNFPLIGSGLELCLYNHTPNNLIIGYFFNSCYKMIFRANFILDALDKWKPNTEEDARLKVRIAGEAKFLKSLANFWLVNCFGDVPLKKTLADHYIIQSTRTPKALIWEDIESNLKEAVDELPLSEEYDAADYGRASKGAAIALLGKVYLYQKRYSEAIPLFESLGNAPFNYALAGSLDEIFINDSKTPETIFAVMHGQWQGWAVANPYGMFVGQETWGGKFTHTERAMDAGFNDWWNVVVSEALVKAFTYKDESGDDYTDPRAALTFYDDGTHGGDTAYCDQCPEGKILYDTIVETGQISWRKYEMYESRPFYGQPDSYINSQVIRYGDVLLMLAECYIESNQPDNALAPVNAVRSRSGAFAYTTLGSQDQARTILRHERQLELAGEQSRYFDLVRWGTLKETINAEKNAQIVKDYHILFPIPQGERDANPALNAEVKNNWN
jgi:starch-binding outer membrane protein, SusD/RagB family